MAQDGRQREIDFGAAEAACRERQAALRAECFRMAAEAAPEARLDWLVSLLRAVGWPMHRAEARLLMAIAAAQVDPRSYLSVGYSDLAASIDASCATVRRAVRRLAETGLLQIAPLTAAQGRPCGANSYRIDWAEVLLRPGRHGPPARGDPRIGSPDLGGDQNAHPPAQNEQPPAHFEHPLARAEVVSRPLQTRTNSSGPGRAGYLPEEVASESANAVDPLPPRSLLHGVFRALRERHLRSPLVMLEWFRRQLSAKWPALPGNEAALLLVWCAASHAVCPPRWQEIRSPVGWFVGVVRSGRWGPVLGALEQEKRRLELLKEQHPGLLLGGEEEFAAAKRRLKGRDDG